ncbi:MAG: hypothetical protein ACM3TR_05640 [Caulobacteraceae bacterium]
MGSPVMSSFEHKDFEAVLNSLEDQIDNLVECDNVRSVGGNLNTRGMSFRGDPHKVGTVIVGEDRGSIAVDISILDGAVRSFALKDSSDYDGIKNIVGWFEQNYS